MSDQSDFELKLGAAVKIFATNADAPFDPSVVAASALADRNRGWRILVPTIDLGRVAVLVGAVAVFAMAATLVLTFVVSQLPGPASSPSPTPSPTVPPFGLAGNGVIALSKDGDIVVADRPGGETRPLVAGLEEDTEPMFSPDGTKLAFIRDGWALMAANADGTNIVQLTTEPLDAVLWSWSPDGQSLVGVAPESPAEHRTKRIVVRPLDPAAALTVLDIQLHDGWMDIDLWGGPSFRPTNPQEILIVGDLEANGPRGIYVYDLATGGIRTVVEPAGYAHDVAWSTDGRHISYDLTDETSIRARVIGFDGSGDRLLDNALGVTRDDQVSRWSNDGNRIVIFRQREGQADGSPVVVSTSGDEESVELACGDTTDIQCAVSWIWSPDDSVLLGNGDGTNLLADPDTGQVTELDWDVDIDDPRVWQRVAP